MSRPKYLNCIMTSEIIHRIREEQEYYDKDPEAYKRQKQYEKEQEIELREQEEREYRRSLENREY